MRPEYEEQFRRWLPFLSAEDWHGKDVLDVGCGMGRNSYWPASYGAASVVGIDVDGRSLQAAANTLAPYQSAQVKEMSAYDIDYRDAFDIVFSIGVVHHLEYPAQALKQMMKAAKPGGKMLVWVYGRENNGWIVLLLDPLRKILFSRLPIGVVHHLSLYPTALLWLLLRLGFGRIEYFRLLRSMQFRHVRSIVFDQMLPKIAHYWRRTEVAELMESTGAEDVTLTWVNEMSWAAMGTKPMTPPDGPS
jgi:SAM-dependent methyltransferase